VGEEGRRIDEAESGLSQEPVHEKDREIEGKVSLGLFQGIVLSRERLRRRVLHSAGVTRPDPPGQSRPRLKELPISASLWIGARG
jgi:hypothetical protein